MYSRQVKGITSALLFTLLLSIYALHPHRTGLYLSKFTHPCNECNPFLLPGYVIRNEAQSVEWIPFDKTCAPYSYIHSNSSSSSSSNQADQSSADHKTIFFYGDSVLRNAMEHLCTTLGGEMTVYDNWPNYTSHRPESNVRHCNVPSLGISLVHLFLYGIVEYDESDRIYLENNPYLKAQPTEPLDTWLFEHRIADPAPLLIQAFGQPDIVLVGSGMWDLAIAQNRQLRSSHQTAHHPAQFLDGYGERATKLIDVCAELHPRASIYLSLIHDPNSEREQLGWGNSGLNTTIHVPKYYAMSDERVSGLRLAQLYAASRARQRGRKITVFPFRDIVKALPAKIRMKDLLHPSSEAYSLYDDFLMFTFFNS